MKTGLNFKKVGEVKFMHVHPETLLQYLEMLPKNEAGWITFRIDEFTEKGERNTYAQAIPLTARNKAL